MLNNLPPKEGSVSYDSCSHRKVMLTAKVPVTLMEANAKRAYVAIVNYSNVEVFLHLGTIANNLQGDTGMPLLAKGSDYEIARPNLYQGKIMAVSQTDAHLLITECNYAT